MDNIIKAIEEEISSYEKCVEASVREFDEKEYTDEATFALCSVHNSRGILSGLKRALEIVKSGGNPEWKKKD